MSDPLERIKMPRPTIIFILFCDPVLCKVVAKEPRYCSLLPFGEITRTLILTLHIDIDQDTHTVAHRHCGSTSTFKRGKSSVTRDSVWR